MKIGGFKRSDWSKESFWLLLGDLQNCGVQGPGLAGLGLNQTLVGYDNEIFKGVKYYLKNRNYTTIL